MTKRTPPGDQPVGGAANEAESPATGPVTHFPAAGRAKACPICGKPVRLETRPFCSKRCADIDLGRWLGESYRIPAEEPPDGLEGEGSATVDGRDDHR